MDNYLSLASWTEEFLKLSRCHVFWTELALEPGDKNNACVVLEIYVGQYD